MEALKDYATPEQLRRFFRKVYRMPPSSEVEESDRAIAALYQDVGGEG